MDKTPEEARARWGMLWKMSPQQLESIKEILLNPEEYEALENARIEVENAHLGGRAYIPGTPEA